MVFPAADAAEGMQLKRKSPIMQLAFPHVTLQSGKCHSNVSEKLTSSPTTAAFTERGLD
jgi:hypothetical protein